MSGIEATKEERVHVAIWLFQQAKGAEVGESDAYIQAAILALGGGVM